MLIIFVMAALGLLLGFIGAGGSGPIIAILIAFFNIPVHTALGTALLAMVFTSLSATISHIRENNVDINIGLVTGGFGAVGAFIGSIIADLIPEQILSLMTASIFILATLLLWLRIVMFPQAFAPRKQAKEFSIRFWLNALFVGTLTGTISGVFGNGSTSFIQVGLLIMFGCSIQKSVGTTLMIILPIAFVGGMGYLTVGNLDFSLFLKVTIGTIIGSYIGAKFTNRLNQKILKTLMITTPALSAIILFLA